MNKEQRTCTGRVLCLPVTDTLVYYCQSINLLCQLPPALWVAAYIIAFSCFSPFFLVILIVVSVCTATGAWNWLIDPDTQKVKHKRTDLFNRVNSCRKKGFLNKLFFFLTILHLKVCKYNCLHSVLIGLSYVFSCVKGQVN